MANDDPDRDCEICYEQREDLRMLPCWHVACISCILNMSQTGQGRAVKCHTCREPFLFENVRSLPRPVKCNACRKFVRNPRKFPCCVLLYCADCTLNLPGSEDGKVVCPDLCTGDAKYRKDLLHAKICSMCFCMHAQTALPCGHHMCGKCTGIIRKQNRVCPLCQAVNNPMPMPVNPIQPAPEQMNATIQQLTNAPLQDDEQPISQMQLLSALQTVRLWQQRNPQPRPAQPQQAMADQLRQKMEQQADFSQKYLSEDLPKAGIVLAAVLIVTIVWGFRYWTWVVIVVLLSLLKPIKIHNNCVWGFFFVFMFIYAIWNYFFQTIGFIVMEQAWIWVVRRVKVFFFKNQPFFAQIFDFWFMVAKCIPMYAVFSPVFLHIIFATIGFTISSYFARNVS